MLTHHKRSRKKIRLAAGLGWLAATALAAGLLTLARPQTQGPPPMAAALVHAQLPALHGQVLSLKYIEPLNSYRVRLQNPQGQILSFEQEARTGQLLGLQTRPAPVAQLPEDLLPLESMLHKLFGKADFQLLAVELETSAPQANYALDWIQEGVSFHAHFDARNGSLLRQPQA